MAGTTIDDLLTWSKRSVDPFNRLSCSTEPVLLVIEFCQVQGPRPLHWFPSKVDAHLDLDNVAIWLMSSEVVNGSTVVVYNQQMALYACLHHSTILDIRARGFQRQLSIALLSAKRPSSSMLRLFMDVSRQLVSPVLICNRQLFKQRLSYLIDVSDTLQRSAFDSYYALSPELSLSASDAAKVESVAVQARRLLARFQVAYDRLTHPGNGQCKEHPVDDVNECLGAIGDAHTPLLPINNLAPCAYDQFVGSLPTARDLFLNQGNAPQSGALFCARSPILTLSHFSAPPPPCSPDLQRLLRDDYDDKEQALKAVIYNLDNILYATLSGERLAICGSEQRRTTGMDLLKKLNLLRVTVQQQHILWDDNPISVPLDCQLFGKTLSRAESASWSAEGVGAVLDLNGHTIRCKQYNGAVLKSLTKKRSDSFPTDRSLIAYVISLLTDFCALAYMARHEDVRKLAQSLALSAADVNMLASFLAEIDFLRYARLRDEVVRSDRTVCKDIKL